MADLTVNRTQAVTLSEGTPATGSTVTIAGWSHEINVSDARVLSEGTSAARTLLVTIAGWVHEINLQDAIKIWFDWGGPYNWIGALQEDQNPMMESFVVHGIDETSKIKGDGYYLQSGTVYGGSVSLCVVPGGHVEIMYACNAGDTTIVCYCRYETGGNPKMEVLSGDGSGEVIGSDTVDYGVDQWEQLSVNFTAVKGFYIVRLSNKFVYGDLDFGLAYFDNLE